MAGRGILMFRHVVLIVAVCLGMGDSHSVVNDRPIIGVLTQEVPHWDPYEDYNSFISANYVKAVEASGGRVVPVFIGKENDYYSYLVSKINGLLIPGGSANYTKIDGIAAATDILLGIAKKVNDNNDHFPVLGVCQGMEIMAYLESGKSYSVLTDCSALNLPLPLEFKPGFKNSSLFKKVSEEDITILREFPVTANNHRKCITEKSMSTFLLDKEWKVLTVNKDDKGLIFVSSFENLNYPFVGIQFHPEKNAFEYSSKQNNPHSGYAVRTARLFYDWLINEARRNLARFPDEKEENDALIYNFSPVFTGKLKKYDSQIYYFK